MIDTDLELENHINCHFLIGNCSPIILNEEHGYFTDIDEIVDYFVKLVSQQIEDTFRDKISTTVPYNGKINIRNCFFNEYKLNVTFKKSKENSIKGGTKTSSIFQDENGNWVCIPDINLTIETNNITSAVEKFSFSMGHELTHCYNLLQYALKNDKDPWYSIDRNRYFTIRNNVNFGIGNVSALANILYTLNRMERNAYIAQLKQELLTKKNLIKDNKTAFDLIKNTESYKKFLYLEQQVNVIFTIIDEDVQKDLIDTLNNIMNTHFTTFKQLKKYFLIRWLKWKKAYFKNASKIAYDIFSSTNNSKWLDWGLIDNKSPMIKPN